MGWGVVEGSTEHPEVRGATLVRPLQRLAVRGVGQWLQELAGSSVIFTRFSRSVENVLVVGYH